MTFDKYALAYELKISFKPKFGAEFVATIIDFGEAAMQIYFFKNPPQMCHIYLVTAMQFSIGLFNQGHPKF